MYFLLDCVCYKFTPHLQGDPEDQFHLDFLSFFFFSGLFEVDLLLVDYNDIFSVQTETIYFKCT